MSPLIEKPLEQLFEKHPELTASQKSSITFAMLHLAMDVALQAKCNPDKFSLSENYQPIDISILNPEIFNFNSLVIPSDMLLSPSLKSVTFPENFDIDKLNLPHSK